jgi:hypothetical protein
MGDVGYQAPAHHPSHHFALTGISSSLYQDLPPESGSGTSGGLYSTTLASKLGISNPNPAPEVEVALEPPPEAVIKTGPSMPHSASAAYSALEPKKKYAKEAWPGKLKPMPGLLV